MFWNKKSEIQKVLDKYGSTKDREFLTYFFTVTNQGTAQLKSGNGTEAKKLMEYAISNILNRHGDAYLKEYSAFQAENIKNQKLIVELLKEKEKYTDLSIVASPTTNWCEPKQQNSAPAAQLKGTSTKPTASPEAPATNSSKPSTVDSKKRNELGRDESKHISCDYEGREDDCPKDCSKCPISIKTDGDMALAQNKLDEAIRFYKKAVFAAPKFAEAWVNLGNAYGMKSEYNSALSAFDKAIAVDPVYGKALFGKAITLRNMGKLDEAMKVANLLIELYGADDVLAFKQGLLDRGVKDNKYLFENKKLIVELDNYAYEIMQEHNLLDDNGRIPVIDGLYQPDTFVPQVMDYCRKQYTSLGEAKVRGEYIITSFYGSICATLLHHKDPSLYSTVSAFEYLREHIDVEFTDVNAERMLNTKAGEDKAEYIWQIISPYVGFSTSIFKKVSVLTDELIMAAMKRAYELGMLTAFYYLDGKDKKHTIVATRAELDKALSKLAASSSNYEDPPPESAMCYSIRVPSEVEIQFRCEECSKVATMSVYEGSEDLAKRYKALAKEFMDLGYEASARCVCKECAERYSRGTRYRTNHIIFSFRSKDSARPKYSFPSSWSYKSFEYEVALCFLKGATTVEALSEETGTRLSASAYINHVENVIGKIKR